MIIYVVVPIVFFVFFIGFWAGYLLAYHDTAKSYGKILPNKNLGRRKTDKRS